MTSPLDLGDTRVSWLGRQARGCPGGAATEGKVLNVRKTSIDGCLVVETRLIEDRRGFFLETYRQSALTEVLGRPYRFAQGNHSRSKANVLRGFHTEPWDKLVYVPNGRALIVIADTRPDSPTFGTHECFLVGDEPHLRLRFFVARGLSNAFYCFTDVDYHNDVSEEFDPSHRFGVAWNDPTLGVAWPTATPILSPADQRQPLLSELVRNTSVVD